MIDYDTDDDRLIEIRYLEQLDAIRHDLDGTGIPDDFGNAEIYRSAFPNAERGMGCLFEGCVGYELSRDLDFTDRGSYASGAVNGKWTGGVGWLPIGIVLDAFDAKFEGNGYVISNLYINRGGLGDAGSTGLFGRTFVASEISNVRLSNVQVSGGGVAAGLVGYNRGSVCAVYVAGNITGINEVGGVVGINDGEMVDSSASIQVSGLNEVGGVAGVNNGEIVNSSANGRVSGGEWAIGGLVGLSAGQIVKSFATGNVSGSRSVGGLVGANSSGMITGSYFQGSLAGRTALGGLVGSNDGEIIGSYSAGSVNSGTDDDSNEVGGLTGINYGSIISSYSIAEVRGIENVGGLVGFNIGSITTSYSTGSVYGLWSVGGFTGLNSVTIRASYATGDVSGEYEVGGFSGINDDEGLIITSYAVGKVTDSRGDGNSHGGLVGYNRAGGRIIDSFWDTQSTRQRRGVSDGNTSGVRGGTTAQMQRPIGYTGIYSGWNVDIDNVDGDFDPSTGRDDFWDFGTSSQYPVLRVDFDGDGVASWQEFGDQRGNRGTGCPGNASCP